jgi:hypothetical protein
LKGATCSPLLLRVCVNLVTNAVSRCDQISFGVLWGPSNAYRRLCSGHRRITCAGKLLSSSRLIAIYRGLWHRAFVSVSNLVAEATMRAKKHITPIDMEIIYRAHRSVWAALKHDKLLGSSDETHELSDKVTRTLVEFAREGVIDLETLRERTLAEIMRS